MTVVGDGRLGGGGGGGVVVTVFGSTRRGRFERRDGMRSEDRAAFVSDVCDHAGWSRFVRPCDLYTVFKLLFHLSVNLLISGFYSSLYCF